jgi:hypothetical protein
MRNSYFFTGANALKDLKVMHKHWDAVGMLLGRLEAQGEFSLGKHGRFNLPEWTEVLDFGRTRIKVVGMAGLPIHCVDASTLRATISYPDQEETVEVSSA